MRRPGGYRRRDERSLGGAVPLTLLGATAIALLAVGVVIRRRPLAALRLGLRLWLLLLSGASERTVSVKGLPVRYFEVGAAGGRRSRGEAIVLLHGFGDSAETWARVAPALSREERVLAPDLVGSGRTPIPPEGMHLSVAVEYLAGFLDALRLERAVLIGNSLGGAVAIRYAATHPDRVARLFLLDSAGLHGETPALLDPGTREMARELAAISLGPNVRLPRFILDDLVRRAREPARRAALESNEPVDVTDDLPHITAPTTIIWGEHDRLIPIENGIRLRDEIGGSELIALTGVGHLPQTQAPERTSAIIRERLRRPAHRPR